MKYLRAAIAIALANMARRLHLPTEKVHDLEDAASIRMFECALDFEPVKVITAGPGGWSCEHMNITFGGAAYATVTPPATYCGCEMQPIIEATASQ